MSRRERTFDEVLEEFPYLTILGFSSSAHVSASERDAGYTFAFCWSWLLNARPRVERCAAWLKTHIKPTKTIRRGYAYRRGSSPVHMGSYSLKHRYEVHDPDPLHHRGEFIAAALMAGFPVQRQARHWGRGAWFGISRALGVT